MKHDLADLGRNGGTIEDFSGETLLIGDTYVDDARGVDWGAGHGG